MRLTEADLDAIAAHGSDVDPRELMSYEEWEALIAAARIGLDQSRTIAELQKIRNALAESLKNEKARIRTLEAEIEAEIEALKARRCGTCDYWNGWTQIKGHRLCCNDGPASDCATAEDFSCSAWEERDTEDLDPAPVRV
jgi:hypothetical protein